MTIVRQKHKAREIVLIHPRAVCISRDINAALKEETGSDRQSNLCSNSNKLLSKEWLRRRLKLFKHNIRKMNRNVPITSLPPTTTDELKHAWIKSRAKGLGKLIRLSDHFSLSNRKELCFFHGIKENISSHYNSNCAIKAYLN